MDEFLSENLTIPGEESQGEVNLFPALVQIFLTVFVGYLAGLCNVINGDQADGLNIFVGKFSLPVMLFMSLFKLDFSTIDWAFMIAVLITKGSSKYDFRNSLRTNIQSIT